MCHVLSGTFLYCLLLAVPEASSPVDGGLAAPAPGFPGGSTPWALMPGVLSFLHSR